MAKGAEYAMFLQETMLKVITISLKGRVSILGSKRIILVSLLSPVALATVLCFITSIFKCFRWVENLNCRSSCYWLILAFCSWIFWSLF